MAIVHACIGYGNCARSLMSCRRFTHSSFTGVTFDRYLIKGWGRHCHTLSIPFEAVLVAKMDRGIHVANSHLLTPVADRATLQIFWNACEGPDELNSKWTTLTPPQSFRQTEGIQYFHVRFWNSLIDKVFSLTPLVLTHNVHPTFLFKL
jgi:hypothetical protein